MTRLRLRDSGSCVMMDFLTVYSVHFVIVSNHCRQILRVKHQSSSKKSGRVMKIMKFVITTKIDIVTSEFSASLAGRDASMADMWAHMFGPRDIVVKESNPRLDAEPAVSIEYVEPS